MGAALFALAKSIYCVSLRHKTVGLKLATSSLIAKPCDCKIMYNYDILN